MENAKEDEKIKYLLKETGATVRLSDCDMHAYAYYDNKDNSITICKNYIDFKNLKHILLHELVHAFDYKISCFDSNSVHDNCCTEIRAAIISGECDLKLGLNRGIRDWFRSMEGCVKRRAKVSVNMKAAFSREQVDEAFDQVLNDCFQSGLKSR